MITEIRRLKGWNPKLDPTGKFIAYSVTDGIVVRDVETGTFGFEDMSGHAPHWIRPNTLTYLQRQGDITRRMEVVLGGVAIPTEDNPEWFHGAVFQAADGHWVTTFPGERVILDGYVISNSRFVTHAEVAGNFAICYDADSRIANLFDVHTRQLIKHIRVPDGPISSASMHGDGHIAIGTGTVYVLPNDGGPVDVTSAPIQKEWCPRLFSAGSDLWVSTYFRMASKSYVLLRPIGAEFENVIAVEVPGVCDYSLTATMPGPLRPFMKDIIRLAVDTETEIIIYDVPVSEPRERLKPELKSPDKKLWAGYFHSFGAHGHWPEAQGNCAVITEPHGIEPAIRAGKKIIVASSLLLSAKSQWEHVIGVLLERNPASEIAAEAYDVKQLMEKEELEHKPIIGTFLPAQLIDAPEFVLSDIDWVGVVMEFTEPQSDTKMHALLDAIYTSIPENKKIVILAQANDREYVWTNE